MIDPRIVAASRVGGSSYDDPLALRSAVRDIAASLGWGASHEGESAFARVVPSGARVVVKPNLVLHYNHGPWGIEPLFTQLGVVRAVVEELLRTEASAVVVGDAPLQECNFPALLDASGMGAWGEALKRRDPRFDGPRDYRRTQAQFDGGLRVERENLLPVDRFVTFDLGGSSLLEPITTPGQFRVTQYPPAELERTHAPGRHQFLVARDIIEADVVVNLPKLKTHRKAGITNALKNLIGINGNKEYLPHHRIGGSGDGGDCYPGSNAVKRALESTLDISNSTRSVAARRLLKYGTRAMHRMLQHQGDLLGVEGAWSGNDTIWRTCLDLNRILLHGDTSGRMHESPVRRVLHVVDAVVAGQGDGPLSAEPFPLGLLLGGSGAAAVDHVGALLLGYDPARIPIVAHAFDRFRWPLTDYAGDDVRLTGALGDGPASAVVDAQGLPVPAHYPAGWLDAVRPGVDAQPA